METRDFLQRILPTQGIYYTLAGSNGKFKGRAFDTIGALSDNLTALSERGVNVYYAVASFQNASGRKQVNVLQIRALYLDIDCGEGKPYTDWRAGLKALGQFVAASRLPKPMIVSSGNGLHVYWVLDTAITADEWKPLAEGLKRLTEAHGLAADPAVTTDSARVLRPVGTVNPKGGKTVSLLIDAPAYSIEQLSTAFGATRAVASSGLVAHRPKQSGLLSAMKAQMDYPPAQAGVIFNKCAQVEWAATHQDEVDEPLWYAMLGIAAFCEDAEEAAVSWSENYSNYDYNATLRKLNQWRSSATGPTTCAKFQEHRPKGCDKCKFKDKITSPAQIGVVRKEIEVAADAPDEAAFEVSIPRPFKRTDAGIKMVVDETDIDVCPFDLYPVSYGKDETLGYEVVRYKWKRPHIGWQPLAFRQAYLADGSREFPAAVADQGIVLITKKHTERFQFMLRQYMDELRQLRSVTNLYGSMGWKEDNTQFLLGDVLFRREGDTVRREEVSLGRTVQRATDDMYSTAGDLQEAIKFTGLIEKARLTIHGFALLISMSAPLYQFTGIKGLTINLYGPTGSGKSLAQMWMQSIWGNPEQLHYSSKFTQNALYARMGLYNNLPMTIDETTTMPAKDVGEFLYDVSQGKEKARLHRTTEERASKTWRLPCVTSSNRSMSSLLVSAGMETDAQMMRLLEITLHRSPLFARSTNAGRQIYNFVASNYGMIGQEIITHLLAIGEDDLRVLLSAHQQKFNIKYNCAFNGNERYWETAFVLADFIGEMAIEKVWIQFNPENSIRSVLRQLGSIRDAVIDSAVDAIDLVTEYVNSLSDAVVTVYHNGGTTSPICDTERLPRGDVRIRLDLHRQSATQPFDRGTLTLDRSHFKTWLANHNGDFKTVLRELTSLGLNKTQPRMRAYLGKDTPIRIPQTYVLCVDLNHDRLRGLLNNADANALDHGLSVIAGGKGA